MRRRSRSRSCLSSPAASEAGMASLPAAAEEEPAQRPTGESIMPGVSTIIKFCAARPERSLSCVRCASMGPKCLRPEKPRSGSPSSAGPARSISSAAGPMMVKLSSVGATPETCTSRLRIQLTKEDLPEE